MKVLELRELKRRETPIHYISEYTAVAVLESSSGRAETSVAFTLERKPLGTTDIVVRVIGQAEWPLLPVVRAVRDHVTELDGKGLLP